MRRWLSDPLLEEATTSEAFQLEEIMSNCSFRLATVLFSLVLLFSCSESTELETSEEIDKESGARVIEADDLPGSFYIENIEEAFTFRLNFRLLENGNITLLFFDEKEDEGEEIAKNEYDSDDSHARISLGYNGDLDRPRLSSDRTRSKLFQIPDGDFELTIYDRGRDRMEIILEDSGDGRAHADIIHQSVQATDFFWVISEDVDMDDFTMEFQ